MLLPTKVACRWTAVMICVLSIGLYAGFYISIEQNMKCSLEVCDKHVQDMDYYREVARQLKAVTAEIQETASLRTLKTLRNLIAALDPQQAVSAPEEGGKLTMMNAASPDACGEIYKAPEPPFYQVGYIPDPACDPKSKPALESLVTVLLMAPASVSSGAPVDKPLAPLRLVYPNLTAIVATDLRGVTKSNATKVVNVKSSEFRKPGTVWNRILQKVTTPYVLVARGVKRMDEMARLSRLLYVLSASNMTLVGGAIRHASGRWRAGCLQTRLRRYSLRVLRGYRHSAFDCMLCDHLEGPFLTYTDILRQVPFHIALPASVLFEDWFLRVKRRGALVAACPDSLFFLGEAEREPDAEDEREGARREAWRHMAMQWKLDSVFPDGRSAIRFSCTEVGIKCELQKIHNKGLMVPGCCVKEAMGALKAFDDFVTRHGLDYEVSEGTLMGGVKLRAFLPWDIDADMYIRYTDFEIYRNKKSEISSLGYAFDRFTVKDPHKYFYLTAQDIVMDVWCRPNLSRILLPEEMRNVPTKLELNGLWLRTFWNPGLTARNRYGPGFLQHALHWRRQGIGQNGLYRVGNWGNCSYENHHSCLNKYPTEGSFGFSNDECV